MDKTQIIAFYLPQFHPTPENNEWWGKGYTEWTNVAKAKRLYKEHYQPKIPADLGFYDLRLPEVREEQVKLARRAGVSAFCYWHYWFGNGKRLLETPFNEVLKLKKPDFPFCLAWANHDWVNKAWTNNNEIILGKSKTLIKQQYLGEEDYVNHFYSLLDAFKDKRYFKIHGKLLFMIYNFKDFSDFPLFKSIWERLAEKEKLPGFYFMTHVLDSATYNNPNKIDELFKLGYNGLNISFHYAPFELKKKNYLERVFPKIYNKYKSHVSVKPQIIDYKDAIQLMDSPLFEKNNIYPTIIPNWDHTPRSGRFGRVFHDCTPELFEHHAKTIINRIKNKEKEERIIFLKSWNEWGEGNYMEPDLRYGCQFIDALSKALNQQQ